MDELILVRHGESRYMVNGLTGGWTDAPLTELGRLQAEATGKRLSDVMKEPYTFYSSDLKRAAETAHSISIHLGREPVLTAKLRELNNGRAANKTKEQAREMRHPETDPILDWVPYPEAESWRMLHTRVTAFFEEISHEPVVLVVAHSMAILSAIYWWLALEEHMLSRISFDIDVCSITWLTINTWGEKTVKRSNDTSHLLSLKC
ncbi:MAG: histidine phosphatase family protein [Theionarchaea archaeon]|nr:histidine phosphatase family protein [Theionarchaea archaeon]MBU7022368.1 histidine phosphatase family protein [Theionarchaea archaeon]